MAYRALINPIYQFDITCIASLEIPWEKLNNKTFLITGATGMISSVIIDILMKRNKEYGERIQIIAISRNEQKARERFEIYWDAPGFHGSLMILINRFQN